MSKTIPSLSKEEIEILRLGKENVDYITDYFFRPQGADQGWRLDHNFDPEGAWQKTVHYASQKRIIVIGGFGSGKTKGVALSACAHALLTRDFKFLNAAPHAWQSELMYRFILEISRGTPFERLIYAHPKRPYPTIELRFFVEDVLVVATMEFMSVDENASQILGWEGDWANMDEAGQLDDLGGSITNLGSRMRGSINGRPYLGRLTMISNSWDNPELWYRYDLAASLPEDYLSLTVSTRHNRNVTDDQLRLMLKDIPEEEHQQFIDGTRPEGKGTYFSRPAIYACESEHYSGFILDAIKANVPGYFLSSVYGAGVVYLQIPRAIEHDYILIGDPGTDQAPNRNAPVLMVWDVTEFPKKVMNLVALWWGAGHGSITPFVRKMLEFMAVYNPLGTYVDNTGPQKNAVQLLNTYISSSRLNPQNRENWLGTPDLSNVTNPIIQGLDFTGNRKPTYLIAGKLMLEANLMIWPKFVVGLRSQLSNYDPEKDRYDKPKIPQDLVATFCMSAYIARAWFPQEISKLYQITGDDTALLLDKLPYRDQRSSVSDRELRTQHIVG